LRSRIQSRIVHFNDAGFADYTRAGTGDVIEDVPLVNASDGSEVAIASIDPWGRAGGAERATEVFQGIVLNQGECYVIEV